MAANGGFHGLDLRPELLGGDGAFGGAVDEGVGGGFAFGVDQQFFVKLLAGAQAGAHDLDVALGVLGVAQRQAA